MLIIEKAVGPFVDERLSAFRAEAERLSSDNRYKDKSIARLPSVVPPKAILSLKICDPAMGSGHFLVSLVDWLADKVLAAMAEAETVVDWCAMPSRSPVLH